MEPDEGGRACPELYVQTEDCIDCVLAWDAWSECSDGRRERHQFVQVEPVGAGDECPPLDDQTEGWRICFEAKFH